MCTFIRGIKAKLWRTSYKHATLEKSWSKNNVCCRSPSPRLSNRQSISKVSKRQHKHPPHPHTFNPSRRRPPNTNASTRRTHALPHLILGNSFSRNSCMEKTNHSIPSNLGFTPTLRRLPNTPEQSRRRTTVLSPNLKLVLSRLRSSTPLIRLFRTSSLHRVLDIDADDKRYNNTH